MEIEAEHGSLAVSAEFLILEWDLLSRHSSRAFLELREICPKLGILVLSGLLLLVLSQAGNTCPKLGILVLSGPFLLLGHKRSGLLAPRQMDCDVRPTVEHCCEKLQISLVSNYCRQIFLHPANCDVQ